MKRKFGKAGLAAGCLLVFFCLAGMLHENGAEKREPDITQERVEEDGQLSGMEVHFLDVGQGDATLVKCGGHAMLIDAADDSKGTYLQNYLQKQGVTRLDYLILTHPDSDHIGGAPVVITKFDIGQVFVSNYEKDNRTYQKLIQALDDKGHSAVTPKPGETFYLGSAAFTILGPDRTYEDPNNASVVLLLRNGKTSFLFTGDAETEAEEELLENGMELRADVYHAGHHGSRTASSETFLDAVKPEYAVVSCGENNSYGHPHAQTLNVFRSRGIRLFRTDEQGCVVAESDGETITWNCAPSETWKAGEPSGAGNKAPQTEVSGENATPAAAEAGAESTENATPAAAGTMVEAPQDIRELSYVLNVKTKKFHRPDCSSLPTTNRRDTTASRDEVIAQGYVPCKKCDP